MRKLFDIFWPTLENLSAAEQKEDEIAFNTEVQDISNAYWSSVSASVLDEAHRLYDEEEERRRIADSKATTYLLFAAALIPVLTYFEGVIWGDKIGSAPRWLTFSILVFASMYAIGFGYWAFKTMRLVGYHRIATNEVATLALGRGERHGQFIRKYLECTRRNQDINNNRLSYLKMAHEFLYRTFLLFATVVVLESGYGVYDTLTTHNKKELPTNTNSVQTPNLPNSNFERANLLKISM